MRTVGFCLAVIIVLSSVCERAVAQISSSYPTMPPAGNVQQLIRTSPGVPAGPASPAIATLPRASLPPSVGLQQVPAVSPPVGTALGAPYQYWSPSTAVWNIQERLSQTLPPGTSGQPGPAAILPGGQLPALGGLPPGLPLDQGIAGSALGLDSVSRRETAREASPAAQAQDAAAPAAQAPPRQFDNTLEIPFEEFGSFEEFRTWLSQQLAAPDSGAVGRSLARLEAEAAGVPSTAQRPGQRPPIARSYDERPPIGYVGVGSSAAMPLGPVSLGPNVAEESARVVAQLNQYARQARTAKTREYRRDADGRVLPPLPRSNLGRQARGSGLAPFQAAPVIQPFTPPSQPQWQNWAGREAPSRIGDAMPFYGWQ